MGELVKQIIQKLLLVTENAAWFIGGICQLAVTNVGIGANVSFLQ